MFGVQHYKETWRKWLYLCQPHPNTVASVATVLKWNGQN